MKIAELWADKIIKCHNEGSDEKTYKDVPAKLKDEVKKELTDKGYPELAK